MAKPAKARSGVSARELTLVAIEHGAYIVESTRPDGTHNRYHVQPNLLWCDCPAGHRRRNCLHLDFVNRLLTEVE
jgi:hypothetical protein